MQFQDKPHNDLLVSVCNAMRLDDVTTFGIPGVCTGPLDGLTAQTCESLAPASAASSPLEISSEV